MENEINLKLRSDILDMALTLESSINQLITVCLGIEHPDPKAIGNKSNSLSFKSKLDLLNDLEIVSKEEYSKLLLVMEFRNQFLHNIDCNSFNVAIDLLGSDRGKHLLKFDDLDKEAEQEFRYNNAYKGLFLNCLQIILDKYEKRKEKFAEKREVFSILSDYIQYIFDSDEEIMKEIMVMCMPQNGDDPALLKFKTCIFSFITEQTENLQSTDKYKQLRGQLESIDSIKIRQLLKRL